MKQNYTYPLFLPPSHLSEKNHKHWTEKEANEYKEWLLSVLDSRVNDLTQNLDSPLYDNPSEHLLLLGEKVVTLFKDAAFTEKSPRGKRLSNLGYSLAADMGLLVAKYLLDNAQGKLKWTVIRKPKSELSYNLPVLEGFNNNYLDPIGGSTAEASAIITGKRGPDAWKRIYEFWSMKIT